ncbi:hypothetical protein [Candidatus Methylomirabilis sp.]|uniref:hypothetical protein n=1 Tax=Candidatus Methylomirabilis sp. TaxID=2032687 RepID=UPI0030767E61
MAESTLARNCWTITRKATVVRERLRGGETAEVAPGASAQPSPTVYLASFVGLFLEILLLRGNSSDLCIFADLTNFVLIACFLGFGFGAYLLRRRVRQQPPQRGSW